MNIKELVWHKDRSGHFNAEMEFGNNYNSFRYGETNGSVFALCRNLNLQKWDLPSLEFAKQLCELTYKEECEKIYSALFDENN